MSAGDRSGQLAAPSPDSSAPALPGRPALVSASAPVDNGGPAAREQAAAGSAMAPNTVEPPIIGEFAFRFDAPLREQLDAVMTGGQLARILFPVSEGRVLDLGIKQHDARSATEGDLIGLVDDNPLADAVLAYVDEAVAGTIVTPEGELFVVRYAGGGVHRVMQLDPERMPGDSEPLHVPPTSAHRGVSTAPVAGDQVGPVESGTPQSSMPGLPGLAMDGNTPPMAEDFAEPQIRDGSVATIDVLVMYTAQSSLSNGGTAGMNALINAAAAKANLAYRNSLVPIFLKIVHTQETRYAASGSLETDLGRLQNPSDGFLDVAYTLRAQHNADIVSLFVTPNEEGVAGLAYLVSPYMLTADVLSNWVVSAIVDVYADSNMSFAHEVSHNFGCGHGMGDGRGFENEANGYRFLAANQWYRTVMAYAPGIRIPYFSNPSVTYLGVATGTSSANNALALTRARIGIANLRFGVADMSLMTTLDVNGDSKPDLLWRNRYSGESSIWQMNGLTQTSSTVIRPAGTLWWPIASVNFNRDPQPGLLWRNVNSGAMSIWYMNGLTTIWSWSSGFYAPYPASEAEWAPMLVGDFNHDTWTDVVMRNTRTGQVMVWYLIGTTTIGQAQLTTDPTWVPFTAADLNGDSKPDIVWRNSATGKIKIIHYDNLVNIGARILLDPVNADQKAWRVMAAGDFNGDGKEDLVWRNTDSGRVKVFYMDGGVNTGVGWISQ